ncbi:hypothetical protein ES703_19478 [subsurface metagenome]
MTTLIIFREKDGRIVSRCDARCYNAKGHRCICVCGGYNHGVGIDEAIENTRHFEEQLKDTPDAGELAGGKKLVEFFPRSKPRKEVKTQ